MKRSFVRNVRCDLTGVVNDVTMTSSRHWSDNGEVAPMGSQIREELGRLRLKDLLREADERSKHQVTRRSTRRPSPRTGEES